MRPITAAIMIAPNITFGVYWNNGMRNSSVTKTVTDITTFDIAVLAPALWLIAERENDPEVHSLNGLIISLILTPSYMSFTNLQGFLGHGLPTCCNIAGCCGANHVHESDCHHFLISIHFVVSYGSKCSSHCNSFLFQNTKAQLLLILPTKFQVEEKTWSMLSLVL